MAVTAFNASLLAFLFVFLSARVIVWLRAQKVEIGDGQDRELLRRSRVHANFVEYAPLFLVLLGLAWAGLRAAARATMATTAPTA